MSKLLIAYFSASGTTAKVAKQLSQATNADLYEIKPKTPYTKDDLNWMDKNSRSSIEMNDKSFRPALKDKDANIQAYDIVALGFPIWWYVAPNIINTFLESYDFSGKTVVLFATSGGSGFGKTVSELKNSIAADTKIIEGKILNNKHSVDELAQQLKSLCK